MLNLLSDKKILAKIIVSISVILFLVLSSVYLASLKRAQRRSHAEDVFAILKSREDSKAFQLAKKFEKENNYLLPIIGFMYRYGLGTAVDPNLARKYYEAGVNYTDSDYIAYDLATMLFEGVGGDKDQDEGIKYFKLAVSRGSVDAAFWLGNIYSDYCFDYPTDLIESRKWLEVAAERGHKDAMMDLSWMYLVGWGGERDLYKAAYWKEKAQSEEDTVSYEPPKKSMDYYDFFEER